MSEGDSYSGQLDRPLTEEEIELAKAGFVEFHGSLDKCECVDCALQKNNECVFQFDPYNTKGDWCLMDK